MAWHRPHSGSPTTVGRPERLGSFGMRQLPEQLVFTAAEAQALGWTESALRHAVGAGRLVRLRRGIYAPPGQATPQLLALAAALNYPQGVISHRSAALMHGLPLVGSRPTVAELTVPPRSNTNLPDVHVHRARLRTQDVQQIAHAPVTSPTRTLVDLGRLRPVRTSVAATDAALHDHLVQPAEIEDVLAFCWNWPGIRRAQRAADLADGRAESPLESVSRLAIRDLGLPGPELQVTILDQFQRFAARADFYWDEFGVVGEADGRSKYAARPVLTAEKARQELLEELGLVVVPWGWDEATSTPWILRTRLARAFERGRLRDRSGFPRLWTR
jgi:hypothetical protein